MNNSLKPMMLVTGSWGQTKTFKMIPLSPDAPYNEAIFDRDSKVLALIGKEKKQSMHMVAKLDDNGDVKRMKIGRRDNGKDYAEERKTLETYYEYYLDNPEEIKEVINLLCVNADSFDYVQYLEAANIQTVAPSIVTP
jgi:HD-GYP domain-containing protein (c-di-GMP phosphodiesterase class II)